MSRRSKRRLPPSPVCDVPGCGQAIRFVGIMRYDRQAGRETQRWVAINTKPVRPGDEDAAIAAVHVTYGNLAADVPEEDRAMVMERAGKLYVPHVATCLDPNWRRMQKARPSSGRPGED